MNKDNIERLIAMAMIGNDVSALDSFIHELDIALTKDKNENIDNDIYFLTKKIHNSGSEFGAGLLGLIRERATQTKNYFILEYLNEGKYREFLERSKYERGIKTLESKEYVNNKDKSFVSLNTATSKEK